MMMRGSPNSHASAPVAVSRLLSWAERLESRAVCYALATLVSESAMPYASAGWKRRFRLVVVAVGSCRGVVESVLTRSTLAAWGSATAAAPVISPEVASFDVVDIRLVVTVGCCEWSRSCCSC